MTSQYDNVPEELKERPQWVVWKYQTRDGKPTKVPKAPWSTIPASATDLMTWTGFGVAVETFEAGGYDGIGFVFCSGDPYAGIDLDKCRNKETGYIEEWAQEILDTADGYAEVSPSGTGVHIVVKGKAPCKKRGSVEAYDIKRFFTVTGDTL